MSRVESVNIDDSDNVNECRVADDVIYYCTVLYCTIGVMDSMRADH